MQCLMRARLCVSRRNKPYCCPVSRRRTRRAAVNVIPLQPEKLRIWARRSDLPKAQYDFIDAVDSSLLVAQLRKRLVQERAWPVPPELVTLKLVARHIKAPTPEQETAARPLNPLDTLVEAGVCNNALLLAEWPLAVALPKQEAAAAGDAGARFGALLAAFPDMEIKPSVVMRAIQRYGHMVNFAERNDSAEVAREAYLMAEALPSLSTVQKFRAGGYLINGPLHEGSVLTLCYKSERAYVLKPLDETELANVQHLRERLGGSTITGITPFELHHADRRKSFMIMPKYELVLESLAYMTADGTARFWSQMKAALSALHALGLAHCDVKPANICVTAATDFVLVDLGSVQDVGRRARCTPAYIPHGFGDLRSSPQLDWWMLAMTMAEKCCQKHGMLIGAKSRTATMAELRAHLQAHLEPAAVWTDLSAVLDALE